MGRLSYVLCKVKLLTGLLMIFGICSISVHANTRTSDFSFFINAIIKELHLAQQVASAKGIPVSIRSSIIEPFCLTMQKVGSTDIPVYHNADYYSIYNPKQSAFVHIVCGPFGFISDLGDYGISTQQKKQYFLTDDRIALDIYSRKKGYIDNCDPMGTMNTCPLAFVFTRILHRILNDMFTIQQAQLYGGVSLIDNPTDRVEKFVQKYFIGLSLCPDKNCIYPRTTQYLKQYMDRSEKLIHNLAILHRPYIRSQNILLHTDPVACTFPLTSSYSVFLCGIYTDRQSGLHPFVALIYNELFFYRLFMSWYDGYIHSDNRLASIHQPHLGANISYDISTLSHDINQHVYLTHEVVRQSLQQLQTMALTFPIHIGLSLYYEDLLSLRKVLVTLIPPVYTLADKLTNVQEKN